MSEFWAYADLLPDEGPLALSPEESRHVSARRLRVGDALVAFDGRGKLGKARLESASKREAVVCVEEIREQPRGDAGFILASAIPKGDRLSSMLPMLSQLGLQTWQPLVLEESVAMRLDPSAPRLRRILIESAKVARRPWLLAVEVPCSLADAIARHGERGPIRFGDREGAPAGRSGDAGLMAIGPEAGFSAAEHALLRSSGAEAICLAPYNLRIETAAVAAAAVHVISEPHEAPGQVGSGRS